MIDDSNLLEDLRVRIRELEAKIDALRMGRRVLMNLIESVENENRTEMERLKNQNERLQKNNSRYAKMIMVYKGQISQMEVQLSQNLATNKTVSNTFT